MVYIIFYVLVQTRSFMGNHYFITDDYSHYCRTYFLRKKSDALERLKELKVFVENWNESQGCERVDKGGEYLSYKFLCFLTKFGI